ncbi:MAG: sensor domain-containing diguanylate cyclase [Sphaerochaetaceae bacterium]
MELHQIGELLEHKNLLNQLIDLISDFVFYKDLDGKYLGCNKAFEKLVGKPRDEIVGMSCNDVVGLISKDLCRESDLKVVKTGKQLKVEGLLRGSDGQEIIVENLKAPLYNSENEIVGVIIIGRNITLHKKAQEALKKSEVKYRLITENVTDVIWVLDVKSLRYLYISPSIMQLRGLTVEEAMKETIEESMSKKDYQEIIKNFTNQIQEFLKNPLKSNSFVTEIQQRHKNKKWIWVEISAVFRHNSDGNLEIVGVSRNIEERKKREEKIIYLSTHDYLTDIFNFRHFQYLAQLEFQKLANCENSLFLLMIDIDNFKSVNDRYGHQIGDDVLKLVVKTISSIIDEQDLFARYGGEEFMVLMKKNDSSEAINSAEIIRKTIGETPHPIAGKITLSIGVAECNKLETLEELYRKADRAMYEAKKLGKNRVVVSHN